MKPGVSLPCSRLRRKAAALDGMQPSHDPSGTARFARLTQPGSARRLRLLGSTALWAATVWLPLAQNAVADDVRWVAQRETSELAFAAWYDGEKLAGKFNEFQASVIMDESGGGPGVLTVQVELGSADMNDREINAELAEPDWFHVASFPRADFHSDQIQRVDSGFLAVGHLRLKGIDRTLEIPLDWQRDGDTATLSGTVILSRLQWQIGSGEWADDTRLEDRVELHYTVDLAPEH